MPTIDTLLFIHLCLVTWFVFLYVLLPRIGFANSIDYYCQMSQCFRDKSCGSSDSEDDETCKKRCRSKCCSFSRNKAKQGHAIEEANERLCNTSAERECRKSCFESRDCGDSDDCKKVRLRIQFYVRKCGALLRLFWKYDFVQIHWILQKCRFKCCYEDDRLCNTVSFLVSNFQWMAWSHLFYSTKRLILSSPPSRISAFSLRRKVLGTIVLSGKGALAAMTRRIAIAWPFAGIKIANSKMQTSSATYNLRPRAVTSA